MSNDIAGCIGITGLSHIRYRHVPTVAFIQQMVASHFGFSVREMSSDRRSRRIARPRQIAMYLAYKLTPKSFPVIGREFNRDHTTIMHGVRTIERMLRENAVTFSTTQMLRERIEAALLVEIVQAASGDAILEAA